MYAIPYTLIFLVIASQVLLVLFIGVVSTSMDEARQNKELEAVLDVEIMQLCEEKGLSDIQLGAFQR